MPIFKGGELVPISTLIESAVILKAYGKYSAKKPRPNTAEFHKAKHKGYVFSKWINFADNTMLMVKPSKELLAEITRIMGYKITAIQPMDRFHPEQFNIVVSDESGITSAIVGEVTGDDFNELIKNAEHIKGEDND